MTRSLLVEIGTEELPIHAIDELAQGFARGVCEGLGKRGIAAAVGQARVLCTPRRLAVLVPEVADAQPQQQTEAFGPYLNVALDAEGQPTRALLGFAQKCRVEWTQLQRVTDNKGERFVHRAVQPGQPTPALVPQIVTEALSALPVAKPMRWGDHDYSFVRPVHWLVMLHGDAIIEGGVLGLRSGRQSRGHRFMHPKPVHLADADSYLDALRAARVLADPAERRARIRERVLQAAQAGGGQPQLSETLLDEIANLTEWPVAIACAFDSDYLAVPHEALVMTMEANQKFVPVFNGDGKLTERFIGIANIESRDSALIRHGYERVIRPRFADAKFFCDEDLKTPLAAHQQALRNLTYQHALGSVWDKTVRVAELARAIANRMREHGIAVDAALATHAAALSRCDLLTRMVGEFPELQGVMGRHYAAAQGECAEVADALDQFYRPRNAGDGIARGPLAQALSIADKLDTLAGIFAVGMKPSGNKDPFALRRTALGLARTLVEGGIDLDLRVQLREALEQIPEMAFAESAKQDKSGRVKLMSLAIRRELLSEEIYLFVRERLRSHYLDRGITVGEFEAVVACDNVDMPVRIHSVADFDRRLSAVTAFAKRAESVSLAAANKRVGNLLRKEMDRGGYKQGEIPFGVDETRLQEPAERELWSAIESARKDTHRLVGATEPAARNYEGALARLAELQGPVDRFFDSVMVMAEDAALRANRLALLAQLRQLFLAVADIALL